MSDNELSLSDGVREASESAVTVASEAIVVIDLVESTFTSNLFGWYAVGRGLLRELRAAIRRIGADHNIRCMKSTGDGYLVTYGDSTSAELGAIHAMDASLSLLEFLRSRNLDPATPEERSIGIRVAMHFGQVDVIENDREGPDVSYAFRLEGVNREALQDAIDPVPAADLPLRNYILYSESVKSILDRRSYDVDPLRLGLFSFKGFVDWHEVYLIQSDGAKPA